MRLFWILFGLGAQALFLVTVWRLVPFLEGEHGGHGWLAHWFARNPAWFLLDAFLALQFALVHSWLLLPATRDRLQRLIPGPLYGCFFCVATCLSLLVAIESWQVGSGALWQLQGVLRSLVLIAFALCWVALFYSLYLSGLGYQTGWAPWWAWVRGRELRRGWPEPRGAYRWLRHPVYLSFLGLVWLTPAMTLDRAVLVVVWTAYIFVGSQLKDRRLLHYVGDPYRRYMARVPGYPFVPFGPLARVPLPPAPPSENRRAA